MPPSPATSSVHLLALVRTHLEGAGHQLVPCEHEGLQCIWQESGTPVGVASFIPAKTVLALEAAPALEQESTLAGLWERVLGPEHFSPNRRTQYLYLVGTASEVRALENNGMLRLIEDNRDYAQKFVVTQTDLSDRLRPLFETLPSRLRANEFPTLRLLAELRERTASDLSSLTQVLGTYDGNGAELVFQLKGAEAATRMEQVSRIYSRIMGRGFSLSWSSQEVRFCQQHSPLGVPVAMASKGERAAFELACFLANASNHVVPGMTLGVYALLSCFDTLKQVSAMDVLRAFVLATGASLQVQSAKESLLRLLKARMQVPNPSLAPQPVAAAAQA